MRVNKSVSVRIAGDVKMKGPLWRPKCIWEDDIKMDVEECNVSIWAVFICSG
jgi:hypothetical protein